MFLSSSCLKIWVTPALGVGLSPLLRSSFAYHWMLITFTVSCPAPERQVERMSQSFCCSVRVTTAHREHILTLLLLLVINLRALQLDHFCE